LDENQLFVNCLKIGFNFKIPVKDYKAIITLKSVDLNDVRRFFIIASALPQPVKAKLEMVAPQNEIINQ